MSALQELMASQRSPAVNNPKVDSLGTPTPTACNHSRFASGNLTACLGTQKHREAAAVVPGHSAHQWSF